MTVAELIAKLQEMPQDIPIYRGDASYGALAVDEVDVTRVSEPETASVDAFGHTTHLTYRQYEVVIIR